MRPGVATMTCTVEWDGGNQNGLTLFLCGSLQTVVLLTKPYSKASLEMP